MSLLVNSSWNSGHGPHVHLPFLAFAIPAVAAVVAIAVTARLRWRRWQRAVLIAVIAVVGAAVTAGCISELSVAGSAVARGDPPVEQPGTSCGRGRRSRLVRRHRGVDARNVAGHRPPVIPARRVVGRCLRPRLRRDLRRTCATRDIGFRATTSDAGALLLVFFFLTGTALALIRQREIEREVLDGSSAGPGFRWLGVLAVPLVLIAGASLLVAVGGGPLVRFAGHAALAVGRAIGWASASWGISCPAVGSGGDRLRILLSPTARRRTSPTGPSDCRATCRSWRGRSPVR